jgi:hypothetical protein
MRKKVGVHPLMRKVVVELHSVVFVHQLKKSGVKQVLHVNRERLGGEHQHIDMYVIGSLNVGTFI